MKTSAIYAFSILIFCLTNLNVFSQAIIADHTKAKLGPIPAEAIELAKSKLHIAYDHTSHGSQIITGMNGLMALSPNNLVGSKGEIYNWNEGGTDGALDIDDYFSPVNDLGYETTWAPATRDYLDDPDNADVNVVMWSWCNIYGHDIDDYLANMESLITEYGPGGTKIQDGTRTVPVTFVFMTGHTNDGGQNEWTFNANKQIRQHCINNNRVLFDFYDIECYDPDGNYFGDGDPNTADYGTYNGLKDLNDDCSYNLASGGRGNWATEWRDAHTENIDWYSCSSSHSDALNANLKAYAVWWLWARLAGWSDEDADVAIVPDQTLNECNLNSITITLTLNDETFSDASLSVSNFQLNGEPLNTSVGSVSYINNTTAMLTLEHTGADFDTDLEHFSITVFEAELTGNSNLTSNELIITANDENLQIQANNSLIETNLDDGVLTINLTEESFGGSMDINNFALNNAPTGLSIEAVNLVNNTQAELLLSFDGTDFDTDFDHFSITVLESELNGCHSLTSNEITIASITEEAPYLSLSCDEQLTEQNLNGGVLNLALSNETFIDNSLDASNFTLQGEPEGCTINTVTYISDTEATITLQFDGTDFDNDITNFQVMVAADELAQNNDLTSNEITIEGIDEILPYSTLKAYNDDNNLYESSLNGTTLQLKVFETNFLSTNPNISSFTLNGNPTGLEIASINYIENNQVDLVLSYNGGDFDDNYCNLSVTINASALSSSTNITSETICIISELEPVAEASSLSGLTEHELNGAIVQIQIDDDTFNSCATPEAFTLLNAPDGVSVNSIDCESEEKINLALGFDGTDFDEDFTNFKVAIDKSILSGNKNLVTNPLTIFAEIESSSEQLNNAEKIKIYPNPADDEFFINYNSISSDKIHIHIIDTNGKTITKKQYNGTKAILEQSIDISSMLKGQYYLVINQGKIKITKPVVIK